VLFERNDKEFNLNFMLSIDYTDRLFSSYAKAWNNCSGCCLSYYFSCGVYETSSLQNEVYWTTQSTCLTCLSEIIVSAKNMGPIIILH
jgi:hypothetical protein